jgi:LEA14-like dessication related protein
MFTKSFFAITVLLLVTGCVKIEEPQFRGIRDFNVDKFGISEVVVGLGMAYYNPNDFTVSVKETVVKVYMDSIYLGDFKQDTLIAVNKNAEFVIPLSGTVPLAALLKMKLKDIHKHDVLLQANGLTRIGKAGVFIEKEVGYRGRHRLDQVRF